MTIVTVTPNTSLDRTIEVPGLVVGRHVKGRLIRVQPGGKGINVARCLAALGVPSAITGLVGEAELPLFRRAFHGSPARLELVPTAQPTRTCTTLLDPELHTDTHVREEGGPVTPEELQALRARLEGLAGPQAIVVFCGSLPPGMDDAHLAALIAACRLRGAGVALDLNGPQLRAALAHLPPPSNPPPQAPGQQESVPQLFNCGTPVQNPAPPAELGEASIPQLNNCGIMVDGPSASTVRPRTEIPQLNNCGRLFDGASAAGVGRKTGVPQLFNCGILVVKPNVEELGECLGRGLSGAREAELVLAASALLDRVGTVLVTRGRAGALAVCAGEALAGALEVSAARNTVGCGDAFLAGYLAALWRGLPLAEALRLAVACGAAQAQAEAPGQISAESVDALAPHVTIRPLH